MILYLDTETTGLGRDSEIVEVAIVDDLDRVLINTLVNPGPGMPITPGAQAVHGIRESQLIGMPHAKRVWRQVLDAVHGHEVVIYNAAFDVGYFPGIDQAAIAIHCAMKRYAATCGRSHWQKLNIAAAHCGHSWEGAAHRALADARACRTIWRWCNLNERSETVSELALPT